MKSPARKRTRRSAGFTVLEMMVAMTVGGIAISSIYAIGAASTRVFREQQRVSTTQSSLRTAMNQLKHDLQRAGYLGTPNASLGGELCMPDPGAPLNATGNARGLGRLAAISAYHSGVARPEYLDPNNLNAWATIDEIILMGNYSTTGEYRGVNLNGAGDGVTIPISSQSFKRDFSNWYASGGQAAGTCNLAALQAAFVPGRLVRVHAQDERNAYAVTTGATCTGTSSVATINLAAPLPADCHVAKGWVSPLNAIRYRVENAKPDEDSRSNPGTVAVLHRTEVDPSSKDKELKVTVGGVERNVDDRVVLDHIVRFSVNFLLTNAANAPRTLNYVPASQPAVQADPQRVRGAIVELVVRTPEHEAGGANIAAPVQPLDPLPPFRVSNTLGAARTRSLRAELLLQNVAFRGL